MNLIGNIGTTEIIVILLLALIVLGPEKLPEMARKVGALVRDLRRMYANLSKELGPELASLPQALQEVRDTADAFKALPRDAIRTFSQAAADAESEVSEAAEAHRRPGAPLSAAESSPVPVPESATAEAANAAKAEEPGA